MDKNFNELTEAEQWHLISQIEASHRVNMGAPLRH